MRDLGMELHGVEAPRLVHHPRDRRGFVARHQRAIGAHAVAIEDPLELEPAAHIVGKPCEWGGGHGRLGDTGYDCSGTVSFALKNGVAVYVMPKAGAMAEATIGGQKFSYQPK